MRFSFMQLIEESPEAYAGLHETRQVMSAARSWKHLLFWSTKNLGGNVSAADSSTVQPPRIRKSVQVGGLTKQVPGSRKIVSEDEEKKFVIDGQKDLVPLPLGRAREGHQLLRGQNKI